MASPSRSTPDQPLGCKCDLCCASQLLTLPSSRAAKWVSAPDRATQQLVQNVLRPLLEVLGRKVRPRSTVLQLSRGRDNSLVPDMAARALTSLQEDP